MIQGCQPTTHGAYPQNTAAINQQRIKYVALQSRCVAAIKRYEARSIKAHQAVFRPKP